MTHIRKLPIFLAIASSLGLACLIAFQYPLFGSSAGFWTHGYYRTFSFSTLLPFFLTAPCVLLLTYVSLRKGVRHEIFLILVWFICAFFMQLTFRAQLPRSLEELIQSNPRNGFYGPTLEYSASEFLHNFDSIRPTLPQHARANMPGKVMLFHLLGLITASPQVMGYLIIVLSNIGGIFLYFAVKNVFSDRRVALFSYILYLFLPCRIYTLPLMNTVSPVLIILNFLLFVHFLHSGKQIWAVLFGFALYLTMFFEPLPMVMGMMFLTILVYALIMGKIRLHDGAWLVVFAAIAFELAHLFMVLCFKFDIFHTFQILLEKAKRFSVNTRPYEVWVKQNLIDFLLNVGVGSSVLFFAVIPRLLMPLQFNEKNKQRLSRFANPAFWFLLSLLVVLAYLEIAAINRGEVTRLWIFLASFWVVGPAYFCSKEPGNIPFYGLIIVIFLQISISINMISF